MTELLYDTVEKQNQFSGSVQGKTLRIMFLRSPLEFIGSSKINEIKLAVNTFVEGSMEEAPEVNFYIMIVLHL